MCTVVDGKEHTLGVKVDRLKTHKNVHNMQFMANYKRILSKKEVAEKEVFRAAHKKVCFCSTLHFVLVKLY